MTKQVILVVDDEELSLKLIQVVLENKYDVVTAVSGEECLHVLEKLTPALILLDLHMTGISGHEVCGQLQAQESTRSIPIIVITADEKTPNRIKAYSNGAVAYIIKPINPNNLQSKIDCVLDAIQSGTKNNEIRHC